MHTLLLAILIAGDDKDEAAAAAKKVGDVKSYAFKAESKTESSGGGGGGGNTGPQVAKYEGKVQKGTGTLMVTDTMEYVRIGSVTASRPRAEWRIVEENPQERGRGRGMGFMGRGAPPKAPHEELGDFGAKIAKCQKIAELQEECTIYDIELTADGAKEFNPMSRMLDRMGGGDISGRAKLWVKDGAIVKYQITTKIEADMQGNAFEMTQSRTVTVSGVDATTVEIPADAKKLIDKSKKEDF